MKFFIETFGCQMNKSDSELMSISLADNGFIEAIDADEADIIIFNTCSVRQHAEDRAIARINSIKNQVHAKNGTIVLAGCMAQRLGDELIKDKIADLVIGPYQSPQIGQILNLYIKNKNDNLFVSHDNKDFSDRIDMKLAHSKDSYSWHKWVTITHGCENYCSYCIVPSVRGKLISFSSETIISYIESLAANGISEITLLGQNVNQYGQDSGDIPFFRLLDQTARIKGIERINFLTSHPKDFSEDIIHVIHNHDNIASSFHLPLQSGSDKILKAMNRKYTLARYLSIIEKIDSVLTDYSLSTDLIVGFPGEDEQDFAATLQAVQQIKFDEAFMYAYSPREGTPACALTETLPRDEKGKRLQTLINMQRALARDKLMTRINREEYTIIERLSKKSDNEVMGKTYLHHPVIIPGSTDDIGKKIHIKIDGIKGSTLMGTRI